MVDNGLSEMQRYIGEKLKLYNDYKIENQEQTELGRRRSGDLSNLQFLNSHGSLTNNSGELNERGEYDLLSSQSMLFNTLKIASEFIASIQGNDGLQKKSIEALSSLVEAIKSNDDFYTPKAAIHNILATSEEVKEKKLGDVRKNLLEDKEKSVAKSLNLSTKAQILFERIMLKNEELAISDEDIEKRNKEINTDSRGENNPKKNNIDKEQFDLIKNLVNLIAAVFKTIIDIADKLNIGIANITNKLSRKSNIEGGKAMQNPLYEGIERTVEIDRANLSEEKNVPQQDASNSKNPASLMDVTDSSKQLSVAKLFRDRLNNANSGLAINSF